MEFAFIRMGRQWSKFCKFAAAGVAAMVGFGAEAATSLSYVQDGLVAQWDGIENVGRGQHDGTATAWTALGAAVDLGGRPRKLYKCIDIGCYECPARGCAIILK